MDGQITPVHLIQPLYKHLMGWPVTFRDLEHVDDQVYRNLTELLNIDDVKELYLEFVVTEDKLGGYYDDVSDDIDDDVSDDVGDDNDDDVVDDNDDDVT